MKIDIDDLLEYLRLRELDMDELLDNLFEENEKPSGMNLIQIAYTKGKRQALDEIMNVLYGEILGNESTS